ncbi:NUT family member 2G-like [Neophocaena asiaeorientalis asiaeorientalis]|uniref:NUT family member 2G-like n=1 Tax=Neophocaena asiaeorientalis asiaeorientalis TaxID=1706337 RepID=A0A341B2S2_NEOAA|nr:NUT family member 2G-like [Neophocaena asiaeorientalis asiaeorientalis]
MVLVRKLFNGAVCGHTCSEVSSPRASQEVTEMAAAHTSSTPPSPEITSQFRTYLAGGPYLLVRRLRGISHRADVHTVPGLGRQPVKPSPVLGPDVIMNPGASLSIFTAVPFLPPIPGPQHRPPWGQHLPPPITPAFPPGSSLLPAFPTTPLVANGGRGPSAPGACNLTVQVRSQGRPVEAPQTQTFIITQGPLTWSAPGGLSGSAACPAPVFVTNPAMETIVTAPAVGVTQAGKGGWTPGFPPQAPPLVAQLVPIIRPVNSGPWPHGTSREGSLATNQPYTSQGDCSIPQSVYSNFRRWQCLKPLARRYLPQSPDAEALSCFLIPVLRSMARLKPTMTLEWGLCRAVQEWQRISNFDRMIYYEIAEKFMEFEVEEEMQIQKWQWMQCAQDLPPPAPPKLDPRGPPAPKVGLQPGTQVPTGVEGTDAPLASPLQQCMRLQVVLTPLHPQQCPPNNALSNVRSVVRRWTCASVLLLAKDAHSLFFLSEVEAVIHPRFLAELLSPDPQLDLLALVEELEQEEGLTPEELVQKRLLALKEDESVREALSHSAPGMRSSPSESDAGQGAQRHDQDPHLGVSDEACPSEIDSEAPHRLIQTDTGLCRPKVFVPSRGRQEVSPYQAGRPSPPQGQRRTAPLREPRDASVLREASPVRDARRPKDGSGEDKVKLPGMIFVVGTQHRMRPFSLSQTPAHASGLASPGGWGAWSAPHAPSPQRRGLSPAPTAAPKSRKWALCGRPAAAEKLPIPLARLGVSGRPGLALGLAQPSQLRKRNRDPFVTERRRKRKKKHCIQ